VFKPTVSGVSLQELEQSLSSLEGTLSGLTQELKNISKTSVVDQARREELEAERKAKEEEARQEQLKEDEAEVIKIREKRERQRQKRAQELLAAEKLAEEERLKVEGEPKPGVQKSLGFLNVVILVDKDSAMDAALESDPKTEAMSRDLMHAIHAKTIIITSSVIVKAILHLAQVRPTDQVRYIENSPTYSQFANEIKNPNKWKMYTSNDPITNMTVLVPQTDSFRNLDLKDNLSINKGFLTLIDWSINTSPYQRVTNNPTIDMEIIKKIILPNQLIRKRIFISGHGIYDIAKLTPGEYVWIEPHIANMTFQQYNGFLKHLNKVGCDFLVVQSCFAGGLNIIDMHKKVVQSHTNDLPDMEEVNFILAVTSISDMETGVRQYQDYGKFFDGLNRFFGHKERGYVKGKDSIIKPKVSYVARASFKDILLPIIGAKLNNLPSVKFPGGRSFFRPVELDEKIEVITYPKLLERELAQFKIEPGEDTKKLDLARTPQPYELGIKKDVILLYPSVVALSLKIKRNNQGNIPLIVSMIPGRARHYIEEIQNDEFDEIIPFITKLFFDHSRFSSRDFAAPKAYFIKKIKLKNDQVFENVLITLDNYDSVKLDKDAKIYYQLQGKYYSVFGARQASFVDDISPMTQSIDQTFSKNKLLEIIKKFAPFPGALYHATGGREGDNLIEKKIEKTFAVQPIEFTQKGTQSFGKINRSIITKPLTIKKDKSGVSPLLYSTIAPPARFYFEKIYAPEYDNPRAFLTHLFMAYTKFQNTTPKAYFIKELQIKSKTYKKVMVLFESSAVNGDDNMVVLFELDALQNKYQIYTGLRKASFQTRRSIKRGVEVNSPQQLFNKLNLYKSKHIAIEKEYDKILRKALGL